MKHSLNPNIRGSILKPPLAISAILLFGLLAKSLQLSRMVSDADVKTYTGQYTVDYIVLGIHGMKGAPFPRLSFAQLALTLLRFYLCYKSVTLWMHRHTLAN